MVLRKPEEVTLIYRRSHVGFFMSERRNQGRKKQTLLTVSYEVASNIVKEGRGAWINASAIYLMYTKKDIRRAVYIRDEGRCLYCDRDLQYKEFTVEHVKPRNYGGGYNLKNLVCACNKCNNGRQYKGLERGLYRKLKKQTRKKFSMKKVIDND